MSRRFSVKELITCRKCGSELLDVRVFGWANLIQEEYPDRIVLKADGIASEPLAWSPLDFVVRCSECGFIDEERQIA